MKVVKKSKAIVDEFGSRVGTESSAINSKLGEKPTTVERLIKATKLTRERVRSHLRYLKGKKLIKERKDGTFVATI